MFLYNSIFNLEEAMEMLLDTCNSQELLDAVILIFFNKADVVPENKISSMRKTLEKKNAAMFTGRTYHICNCSATDGDGLYEGFEWLAETLKHPARTAAVLAKQEEAAQAAALNPLTKDPLELQMEEWLTREDEEDDVFLQKLRDFSLDSWDHRTHLRIAFLLLRTHGRREGMLRIFADIKRFIENSPRTRRGGGDSSSRGTTFHETMTYFWVHMVHYAMASSSIALGGPPLPGTNAAANGETSTKTSAIDNTGAEGVDKLGGEESEEAAAETAAETAAAPLSDFKRFLLLNPQLANGGLFLHYYSKQRMLLDPEARSCVLLPDKAPLPSLLVDVGAKATGIGAGARGEAGDGRSSSSSNYPTPRLPLTDTQFRRLLGESKLPSWGHEVKLRAIYLLLLSGWATEGTGEGDATAAGTPSVGSIPANSSSSSATLPVAVATAAVAEPASITPPSVPTPMSASVPAPVSAGRPKRGADDAVLAQIHSIERSGFHYTLSYFWVKLVSYHMAVEDKQIRESGNAAGILSTATAAAASVGSEGKGFPKLGSGGSGSASAEEEDASLSFAWFLLRSHCQPLRNSELADKYVNFSMPQLFFLFVYIL
jgi:hypothetical protein